MRISQDRLDERAGVTRQREDVERLCRERGLILVKIIEDNDTSAYRGRRPGYEKLLRLVAEGECDIIVSYHVDRLYRSLVDLEELVAVVEEHGVQIMTCESAELDLGTASGRMLARIMGSVARHESERASERIRRAQQSRAEAGLWHGGPRPFGWAVGEDGQLVPDQVESEWLRRVTGALAAGSSLGSVVRELNEAGVLSTRGNRWTHTTVRQVVLREKNRGALVEDAVWLGAQRILTAPGRRQGPSNARKWLLSGVALCGVCGAPLKSGVTTPGAAGTRYIYRCRVSSAHVSRQIMTLDAFVTELIIERLSRSDAQVALAPERTNDDTGLVAEAERLRRKINEAQELWQDDVLSMREFKAASAALRERLAGVEAELGRRGQDTTALRVFEGADPRVVWDALPIDRRQRVVQTLMVITVLRQGRASGKTFRPDLVKIDWK